MRRWISAGLVLAVLIVGLAGFAPSTGTSAQGDIDDEQATQIADLQTRVAVLETVQAERSDDPDALQATQLAGLQTRVAGLETAISGQETVSTPTVTASDEEVLYEANADTGWDGWTDGYFGGLSNQFSDEDGILTAAAGGYTVLFAPYLTTSPDYILEAEIHLLPPDEGTPETATRWTIAGLATRYVPNAATGDREGYLARTQGSSATIEDPAFGVLASASDLNGEELPNLLDGWHTYRFEVRGDELRFLIDNVLIAEATNDQINGFGEDGRVGILASLGPLEVRSFRVLAWDED